MSKYQEAYNKLWSTLHNEPASEIEKHSAENKKYLEALKPLVDRTIPKKPNRSCGVFVCDNCKEVTVIEEDDNDEFKYCPFCGQALDWSEDNE